MAEQLSARVASEVAQMIAGAAGPRELTRALRHLAKWRAAILEETCAARGLTHLPHGPFAGMAYPVRATEGARLPRLLGVYEASLAPVIETIVARAYPLVIDIGAAEGYYAVGLARRMPFARVLARDGNSRALAACAQLAAANGVADRVELGGQMTPRDFDELSAGQAVIICDIEGAELDLLNPEIAPGVLAADLLVEVHEGMRPGAIEVLRQRFEPTHRLTRIDRQLDDAPLIGWMEELSDLDRLILLWEWRSSPTPWLWMERK